uniref:Chitin-binding type-2 domain-containing protein n=1 Tax=Panagrellus redivivus TaxID=6233 RepID=A0A7E4ZRW4_PANRE
MMFLRGVVLIVFIVADTVYGNTGQGIGDGTELQSDEIAEAVKQEVFLKTAGAEPPELDGSVRTYGDIGRGAAPRPESDRRHHGGGIGHGAEIGHRRHNHPDHIGDGAAADGRTGIGHGTNPNVGIGHGANTNVGIGHGSNPHPRFRRISEFKPFDSGYQKECNSYYGRSICYRIYTNSHIVPPPEYTCWSIGQRKRNCTEIDNVAYLKRQGVKSWDTEIPDALPKNRGSTSRPPRAQNSRVNDGIIRGEEKYYDPYRPAGSQVSNQRGNYGENVLNRDPELGDEVSLTRVTRRDRRSSNIIRRNSDEYDHDQPTRNLVNKPKPDAMEDSA